MQSFKRWCILAMRWSGIPAALAFSHRSSLRILLYHGVAPAAEGGIYNYRGKFIPPGIFEDQMRYLAGRYTVLPLDESVIRLHEGTLPPYAAAITFDDGYRNNYEYAFPILAKYGLPATFFLASDFVFKGIPLWVDRVEYAIGRMDAPYPARVARDMQLRAELKTVATRVREHRIATLEQETGAMFRDFDGERRVYAPLTQADISAMHEKGMSFGAHTASHPILARCSPAEATQEIAASRDAIRDIAPVSDIFAYPNGGQGDWSEETEEILKQQGFRGALTTIDGTNTARTHPYRLRRTTMDATDVASFVLALSGVRTLIRTIVKGIASTPAERGARSR